jgi:hypothetical protein
MTTNQSPSQHRHQFKEEIRKLGKRREGKGEAGEGVVAWMCIFHDDGKVESSSPASEDSLGFPVQSCWCGCSHPVDRILEDVALADRRGSRHVSVVAETVEDVLTSP